MSGDVTVSAAPLVELDAVALDYRLPDGDGVLPVLSGVSVSARPGELVCVAGRSGSGKSSLLYIAGGFLSPDSGTVRWEGRHIVALSIGQVALARRGFLGFVFQNAELITSLTALENVALVRGPRGVQATDRQGATALLGKVGIADRRGHFPSQLSGGEQQRVAVARALVGDPPLLIIDEPTAHLDRRTADDIIGLMVDLRTEGRAVLVASHDQRVIERADHLLTLD